MDRTRRDVLGMAAPVVFSIPSDLHQEGSPFSVKEKYESASEGYEGVLTEVANAGISNPKNLDREFIDEVKSEFEDATQELEVAEELHHSLLQTRSPVFLGPYVDSIGKAWGDASLKEGVVRECIETLERCLTVVERAREDETIFLSGGDITNVFRVDGDVFKISTEEGKYPEDVNDTLDVINEELDELKENLELYKRIFELDIDVSHVISEVATCWDTGQFLKIKGVFLDYILSDDIEVPTNSEEFSLSTSNPTLADYNSFIESYSVLLETAKGIAEADEFEVRSKQFSSFIDQAIAVSNTEGFERLSKSGE